MTTLVIALREMAESFSRSEGSAWTAGRHARGRGLNVEVPSLSPTSALVGEDLSDSETATESNREDFDGATLRSRAAQLIATAFILAAMSHNHLPVADEWDDK